MPIFPGPNVCIMGHSRYTDKIFNVFDHLVLSVSELKIMTPTAIRFSLMKERSLQAGVMLQ